MNMNNLIEAALQVRQRAYAPYSKFHVGAAVLTDQGEVFVGCNVENASYGLAICAERMAIGAAVASGKKPSEASPLKIKTIVVAATPLASPCGACRQFIAEFGDPADGCGGFYHAFRPCGGLFRDAAHHMWIGFIMHTKGGGEADEFIAV